MGADVTATTKGDLQRKPLPSSSADAARRWLCLGLAGKRTRSNKSWRTPRSGEGLAGSPANPSGQAGVLSLLSSAASVQVRALSLPAAAFRARDKFPKAPGPSMSHVGQVPKGLRAKPKPVFQA